MAYCTVTDMKKLIPETILINLSNDIPGAVVVNQTNIDEVIDVADREIDAYAIMAGYDVPMDPVPPMAANLSAQMAIWKLHLRKYFASDVWERAYDKCLKTLEKIAEGKLSFGQDEDGVVEESAVSAHAVDNRDQKFTVDYMETF